MGGVQTLIFLSQSGNDEVKVFNLVLSLSVCFLLRMFSMVQYILVK